MTLVIADFIEQKLYCCFYNSITWIPPLQRESIESYILIIDDLQTISIWLDFLLHVK
jgi:hypothetical protein